MKKYWIWVFLWVLCSPAGWSQALSPRQVRQDFLDVAQRHKLLIEGAELNVNFPVSVGRKRREPLSGLSLQFTQGEIFRTHIATNVAVNGQGWFGIRHGRDTFYTRDGRFSFRDGTLSTESGHAVLGFSLDGQGNINSEPGEIRLPMDPRTKLYAGLYTEYHFDETGKLYGLRWNDRVTVPLFQLALYSVAAPQALGSTLTPDWVRETPESGPAVAGVAGQGALGAIYAAALERANVDASADSATLKALRLFYELLLGAETKWIEVSKSPAQDIRRDLIREMRRDPVLYQAALANLENQWTPGYQSSDVLGALSGNGKLRRRTQSGLLHCTNGPFDLALRGQGYFVRSDGSLSRDGRLGGLTGPHLMAYRPGSAGAPEALVVPADATNVEVRADGLVLWTRLGGDKAESAYRIALGRVAHPEGLVGDGHLLRVTTASGPVQYGHPDEDDFGPVYQGYLEMANTDLYEQRLVADVLRYLAGLPPAY